MLPPDVSSYYVSLVSEVGYGEIQTQIGNSSLHIVPPHFTMSILTLAPPTPSFSDARDTQSALQSAFSDGELVGNRRVREGRYQETERVFCGTIGRVLFPPSSFLQLLLPPPPARWLFVQIALPKIHHGFNHP